MARLPTYKVGLVNKEASAQRFRRRMRGVREAMQGAVVENAQDDFNVLQSLVPRRTHYMALHMLLEFSADGLEYFAGWVRSKFVGEVNPVTGEVVKVFYPPLVIHGTRYMAGNPFVREAARITRARRIARIRKALHA
jgi:hypothetical protein